MKAALYTRISTDSQAEVEFNSCETQEIKIRSFISSQSDIEVFKAYSDQGYSGASIDRPSLQEMLIDIQNGNIDLVISYKIDRLTRSPKDFYQLIELFEKHNVSFISVTERFDTSTPSGRLLRNIMLTFAQFERELISERIRDKMAERAKKGMWNSGNTPLGYKRENKVLVIEPKEAEIIRNIYEVYISTGSLSEVYKDLKSKKMFHRNGLPLMNTRIEDILRNILYTGKILYKGNVYKGIHNPIISDTLFEQAQLCHQRRIRLRRVPNYALFPGLLFCKECGSAMSSIFTNKFKNGRRVRYFYYRCCGIVKRDRSFCSTRMVSVDRFDGFVIDNLDKIAKNQQYLDSLIFTLNHGYQDRMEGIKLKASGLAFTAERTREILQEIINASKMTGKVEKRVIMKRHIEKVIYSKETIEVKVLYSESADAASAASPSSATSAERLQQKGENAAAFRHASAAQSRLPKLVCKEIKVELAGVEPASEKV